MDPKIVGGALAVAAVAITAGVLFVVPPSPAPSVVFVVPKQCRSYEGAKSDECRSYWSGFYPDGGVGVGVGDAGQIQ